MLSFLHKLARHQIACVITREDAPVGRKRVLTPSPVAALAVELGIQVIKANRVTTAVDKQLNSFDADLGLVIAYGALLKQRTLQIPKHGWLNIHYSLLPKWRGAAPVQRSLMAGDRETGVTIFRLDEGMDTGDILMSAPTTIEPDENSGRLLERLTHLAISLLDEALALVDSGLAKYVAQVGKSSHAAKLDRNECRIDWSMTSQEIENLIRGANPEPMAYTTLEGETFRILEARASTFTSSDSTPGAVSSSGNRVLVSAKEGSLELIQVQPASKSSMSAIDWVRGRNGKVVFE